MSDPKHPVPGDKVIDASDVDTTDITPEEITKLSKVHSGYERARDTMINAKPADLQRAGISPDEVARLAVAKDQEAQVDVFLPSAEKLAELLREKKLLVRHDQATILAEMGAQIRRRAERVDNGAEVLGPFTELLDYNSGPANKAVATKAKEKKAQTTPPPAPEASTTTTPGTGTSSDGGGPTKP